MSTEAALERLVAETVRGRRDAAVGLAAALFVVVRDAGLAARAMDMLAAEAGPALWIDLDQAVRHHHLDQAVRHHHPPALLRRLLTPASPLATALSACARDGRERKRALGDPLMRTDAHLLPLLLIRSADWAETVRERARKVLAEALTDADALSIAVPVAVRVGERGRGGRALELVRDALDRAGDDTLDVLRQCPDLRGRRFVYDVALRTGRLNHERLLTAALHEPDQFLRTRCAQTLAAQAIEHDRPDLVADVLDGSSARGRVEALTALVRLGHTEHGPRFLADQNGMMRLTAQWAVRRAGGDPAELYRRRIEAGPVTRGLLAGLGDCGTRADAALVLPYLRAPRTRVRAEAVRTLRRLGAETDVAGLLADPSPVVVRSVVTTLLASGPGAPVERLWTLLADGNPRHVRQAAYRLLLRRDVWTRLKADLLLVRDPDERLSRRAVADLALWCRQDSATQYERCPPEAREELADLARAAKGVLSEDHQRTLRAVHEP